MFGKRDIVMECIDRVTMQIIYDVPVADIRESIMNEGHDEGMAYLIYCAAQCVLKRRNPDFAAVREEAAAEAARPSSKYWDDEGA